MKPEGYSEEARVFTTATYQADRKLADFGQILKMGGGCGGQAAPSGPR